MSFTDEVSKPQFSYGSGPTVITLPRPQSFRVKQKVERNVNRSTSGKRETLYLFDFDRITIGWKLLPGDEYEKLRRLWLATLAGDSFTFTRHLSIVGAYPNTTNPVHANTWTVRWSEGFDVFDTDLDGDIKDFYEIALDMEEVL